MRQTNSESEANETQKSINRRSALKTIGTTGIGIASVGVLSGTASADYARPPGDQRDFPITYTIETEDEFKQKRPGRSRDGVLRKITQLTEYAPDYDEGISSDIRSTIGITNITESMYTPEAIERHNIGHSTCFQQLENEIKITHPEYDDDMVRFDFRYDADHIAEFQPPSSETNKETADVATAAIDPAFEALENLGELAGLAFKTFGSVIDAYNLVTNLYEWFDSRDSSSYTWDWNRPDAAPSEFPEAYWCPGRACTATYMQFDVIHDSEYDLAPEITVQDLTKGDAQSYTNEFGWTVG